MADQDAAAAANRAEAFIARRRAAGLRSNRLLQEGSPYLLQHAFNPVDWYPWGEEAFAAAAAADKPLFVSIGYSTCHWCHVMEHESFEDEAIAAVMNEHFVNVKIDREERPDVDRIYMSVVQAVTGSGGWPMSLFLTPQRLPFYAGTYFPPRSAYGRPGFQELLPFLARHWRERRSDVEATAARITTAVRQATGVAGGAVSGPAAASGGSDLLAAVADGLASSFDAEYGGFGAAPKFPRPAVFTALFQHYRRAGSEPTLEMALATLRQMARGGMYDHLGGGFHRYSVDRYWRVPHFEKMLYDQAQLATAYTAAYQITGDRTHAAVAAATLDYLLHDLQAPEGGFYSAEDADSARDPQRPEEKVEGAFYLWSVDQARAAFRAAGVAGVKELIDTYAHRRRQHAVRSTRRVRRRQRAVPRARRRAAAGALAGGAGRRPVIGARGRCWTTRSSRPGTGWRSRRWPPPGASCSDTTSSPPPLPPPPSCAASCCRGDGCCAGTAPGKRATPPVWPTTPT